MPGPGRYAGHPLGIFPQLTPLGSGQPDKFNQFACPLTSYFTRHFEQPAIEIERFFRSEEFVQVRFFGQVADPLVFDRVGRFFIENQYLATGRKEQAEKQLDRGRLARAVGA